LASGLKFMPAVNWVERGLQGNGNTLPRYHIVWGTSRHMTLRMIELAREAGSGGRLTAAAPAPRHGAGHGGGRGVRRGGDE
jgi:predicted oxidoreductase